MGDNQSKRDAVPAYGVGDSGDRPDSGESEYDCLICGDPATCIGRYEGHGPVSTACDTCCGHGNEDGWCVPVERVSRMRRSADHPDPSTRREEPNTGTGYDMSTTDAAPTGSEPDESVKLEADEVELGDLARLCRRYASGREQPDDQELSCFLEDLASVLERYRDEVAHRLRSTSEGGRERVVDLVGTTLAEALADAADHVAAGDPIPEEYRPGIRAALDGSHE